MPARGQVYRGSSLVWKFSLMMRERKRKPDCMRCSPVSEEKTILCFLLVKNVRFYMQRAL